MTDDFKKCLETICDFPTIYKTGDKSPLNILGQSGYGDLFNQVTEKEILKHLDNNEGLVKTWTRFTEDIRHQPAWGLFIDKSKWTVSYADHGKLITKFTFDSANEACAKMIKMTIEELRKGA